MISIECFKGLPIEYESFLIEKYDSYVTTCLYIEIYYPTFDVNYMLVNEDGKLTELLIFGNAGNTSKCFNLFVKIDQNIIEECIKKIFEEYPSIKKIEIGASYNNYDLNKSFLFDTTNDYILNLPSTMEDYYLELGHCTRKTIRKQKSKLLRDYPIVNFVTKFGAEIDQRIIDKIIQLNIDRMKHKGIIYGNNHNKNNIYRYSQHYGCVTYLEIDGEIVAGTISYILNKSQFGYIVGHDNNFSRYSVGIIAQLYEIQTSIDKGFSLSHFLMGENEYKKRLLAKPHILFSYLIYRDYSLNYFYNKNKALFLCALIKFRLSKYSKPIRDVVKLYRIRKWNR